MEYVWALKSLPIIMTASGSSRSSSALDLSDREDVPHVVGYCLRAIPYGLRTAVNDFFPEPVNVLLPDGLKTVSRGSLIAIERFDIDLCEINLRVNKAGREEIILHYHLTLSANSKVTIGSKKERNI